MKPSNLTLTIVLTLFIFATPPLCSDELRLEAATGKSSYMPGEPPFITVRLANPGKIPVLIPYTLCYPNPYLIIVVLLENEPVKHHGVFADYRLLKASKMEVAPGQTLSYQESLSSLFDISREGKYEVLVSYEANHENYLSQRETVDSRLWAGKLEAAPFEFTVEAPKGINKEAYDFLFRKHKAKWEKHAIERKTRMYSDDEIRAEIGRDFAREDANGLLENFPNSLYTAYALAARYHLDRPQKPVPPERAHLMTAEAVLARIQKHHLKPVSEYERSVWPKDVLKKISELELIVQYHPGFVFIDRTYDALGLGYAEKLDNAKAKYYFELAAKAAKTPELKARAEEFIEALNHPEKKKAAQ